MISGLPTTLTKIGGSRFVRIPSDVLKMMEIDTGQEFVVDADSDEIRLTVRK